VSERRRPAPAGGAPSRGPEVFLDTGYLLALELRADQNHRVALEHWRFLKEGGMPRLASTTYVFDETVTYLNSRGLHASAVKVGRRLLASPSLELVHVGEDLFREAFGLLERRPDKRYSLTDCASFVLMRERGIATALAFDGHFEQEGFVREPYAS
jgi:predicted nucleic acid-binding protein